MHDYLNTELEGTESVPIWILSYGDDLSLLRVSKYLAFVFRNPIGNVAPFDQGDLIESLFGELSKEVNQEQIRRWKW